MPATALTPVYVGGGLKPVSPPVAADNTNGNSFPNTADLVIENGTGAQTITFTPATGGAFPNALVTLNLAANTKYRITSAYFKPAFPAGTVTLTASANTVLLRAEQR